MSDIRQIGVPEAACDLAERITLVLAATPGLETEDVGSALGLMGKYYALAWAGVDELEPARWEQLRAEAERIVRSVTPGEFTTQELTWIFSHLVGSMSETARWTRNAGHDAEKA